MFIFTLTVTYKNSILNDILLLSLYISLSLDFSKEN